MTGAAFVVDGRFTTAYGTPEQPNERLQFTVLVSSGRTSGSASPEKGAAPMWTHRARKPLRLVSVTCATALLVAGCGGEAEVTVTSASPADRLCVDLAALATAVGALEELDPASASREDFEAAVDEVDTHWDTFISDATTFMAELAHTDITALEDADGFFEPAVAELPAGISVEAALTSLEDEISAFAQATKGIPGLECEESPE